MSVSKIGVLSLFALLVTACSSQHPLAVKLKSEQAQLAQEWELEKESPGNFRLGPYAVRNVRPSDSPKQMGPIQFDLERDGALRARAGGGIVARPQGPLWAISGLIAMQPVKTASAAEPWVIELTPTENHQIRGEAKTASVTFSVDSAPRSQNALGEDVGIAALLLQEGGKIIAAIMISGDDVTVKLRSQLGEEVEDFIAGAASALLIRRDVIAASGLAIKEVQLPQTPGKLVDEEKAAHEKARQQAEQKTDGQN